VQYELGIEIDPVDQLTTLTRIAVLCVCDPSSH
jgi:hypothetical protein